MERTTFLHAGANSGKLKVILLISEWMWVGKWGVAIYFSSQDPKVCCTLRMSQWIELIFACWVWCNSFLLDQHWTLYLLTFKCQSTVVVLVKAPVAARRILWNRVCPSSHPAVCLISLNFNIILETLMKLYVTEPEYLEKIFFAPKIGDIGQK